jgi:hypothetical protein
VVEENEYRKQARVIAAAPALDSQEEFPPLRGSTPTPNNSQTAHQRTLFEHKGSPSPSLVIGTIGAGIPPHIPMKTNETKLQKKVDTSRATSGEAAQGEGLRRYSLPKRTVTASSGG